MTEQTVTERRPAAATLDERIDAAVEQYGEDAAWQWDVHQIDASGAEQSLCRIGGLDFDEMAFGQKYGPGAYIRRLRIPGVRKHHAQHRFAVSQGVGRLVETQTATPNPTPTGEPEWARRLLERLESKPAAAAGGDGITIRDLLPMMMQMMQPRESLSLKDLLPLLMNRSPATELAELMRVARDAADSVAPSRGGDDGGTLGALAPYLPQLLETFAKAPPSPPPAPRAPAATPTPAQTLPAAPAAPTPLPGPIPPFLGAARIAAMVRNLMASGIPVEALDDKTISRLAGMFAATLAEEGEDPETIAGDWDAAELADALCAYAEDLAPMKEALRRVGEAFIERYFVGDEVSDDVDS